MFPAILALGVIAALYFGPSTVFAPEHRSSGPGSAEYHEQMLAACIGGMTILVGKTLYQCLPSGQVS